MKSHCEDNKVGSKNCILMTASSVTDDPDDDVDNDCQEDKNKLLVTAAAADAADVVENVTSDVVSIVREFIEVLRLEFKQQIAYQEIIPLYTRMKERGLLKRLQSIVLKEVREEETILTNSAKNNNIMHQNQQRSVETEEEKEVDIDTELRDDNTIDFERQRRKVMFDIALPLLENLARCYKILDDLPPSTFHSSPPKHNNNNNNGKSRSRNRDRPIPPRGMLSIQDYTDIACLLEFVVCTGILPSLVEEEEQIENKEKLSSNSKSKSRSKTYPVDDRIRTKLPKSLAGRIPKNALRWGTSIVDGSKYANYPSSNENKNNSNNNKVKVIPPTSTSTSLKAYELLVRTTEIATKLLLLDRFRPMLLPRHLVDIYGACFRVEYLARILLSPFENIKTTTTISTDTNSPKGRSRMIIDPVYYRALGLSLPSSPSPFTNCFDETKICKIKVVVHATLQATAYQTLLFSSGGKGGGVINSSKSQQWLRQRVSTLLTRLATTSSSGLAAIITVFVPVGPSSSESLMSGAAQRLGRTLVVMTSTTSYGQDTNSNKDIDDTDEDVKIQKRQKQKLLGMLCKQLLNLLTIALPVATPTSRKNDVANDKVSNIGIPPRSMAIIQCAWSVFGHLSSEIIDYYIIRPWSQQLLTYGGTHDIETTATSMTTKALKETNSTGVHETIRQLGALCAFVPPHSDLAVRFLRRVATTASSSLSLSCEEDTNDRTESTILEQTLKIAVPSQLGTGRGSVSLSKSVVSNDAEQTLLGLTQAIYAGGVTSNNDERDRVVAAWVSALSQSTRDLEEYDCYQNTMIKQDSTMRTLKIQQNQTEVMEQFTDMVQLMTERAEFFVNNIVLILAPSDSAFSGETKDTDKSPSNVDDCLSSTLQGFPSRIFRFLLRYYLSGDKTNCVDTDRNSTYDTSCSSMPSLKLISTILLPILCEKCSQEQLLFGDNQENSSGLLILIHEVLSTLVASKGKYHDNAVKDATSFLDLENTGCVVTPIVEIVLQLDNDKEHQKEFLSSIASILLSMLIAVIELGSKLRSTEDEKILQSFLPTLRSLSIVDSSREESSTTIHDDDGIAAMADMAAYAMALIASRKSVSTVDGFSQDHNNMVTTTTSSDVDVLSTLDKLRRTITQAEADLESVQPPIRARGMVSLGRLARGFTGTLSKEVNSSSPSLLSSSAAIQELDESGNVIRRDDDDDNITFLIGEILRLSMIALNDTESYVYLASIQTIVAVGDLHPRKVLPLVASAIVSGELSSMSQPPLSPTLPKTTTTASVSSSSIKLSQEQIIKLVEALMFIIRRRAVTDEYIPMIVNLMLYGTSSKKEEKNSGSYKRQLGQNINAKSIQQETDKYFTKPYHQEDDNNNGDDDDDNALRLKKEDVWEEQDIRLKTGGPIFDVEEADVVRSLRISVLSELVMSSSSSSSSSATSVASYCNLFIRLIVEAFHLDSSSRAVTRSAALLGRELYTQLLHESQNLATSIAGSSAFGGGGMTSKTATATATATAATEIPFAVALMSSDEELLSATLQRQLGLLETRSTTIHSINNNNSNNDCSVDVDSSSTGTTVIVDVLDDPTTIARCKEALSIREQAEKEGIFVAAYMVIEERKKIKELPELFRNMTTTNSSNSDGSNCGTSTSANRIFHLSPVETLE